MKSVYEIVSEGSAVENNFLTIVLDKETIERIWADYSKLKTKDVKIIEGRCKARQLYPNLNDLIIFLWETSNTKLVNRND